MLLPPIWRVATMLRLLVLLATVVVVRLAGLWGCWVLLVLLVMLSLLHVLFMLLLLLLVLVKVQGNMMPTSSTGYHRTRVRSLWIIAIVMISSSSPRSSTSPAGAAA